MSRVFPAFGASLVSAIAAIAVVGAWFAAPLFGGSDGTPTMDMATEWIPDPGAGGAIALVLDESLPPFSASYGSFTGPPTCAKPCPKSKSWPRWPEATARFSIPRR